MQTHSTTGKSFLLRFAILALSFSPFAAPLSSTAIDACPSQQPSMTTYRSVKKVLQRPPRHWVGNGFHVYPVFANSAFTEELSPLLMFDYAAPKKFPAKFGAPLGVGQHPHRGFETVTIAFQGEVEHRDNKGGTGVIGPGDVQWMTAGRGIVHEEYHSNRFTKEGGTFEMCQLWVDLPKDKKLTKAKYQAILKDEIPEVPIEVENGEPLGTVRLIAGEFGNTKGAASTFSPVQLWDVSLPHAGSEVELPYPKDHTCIVFVRRGGVSVLSGEEGKGKKSTLGPQDVAIMGTDGSETLKVRVDEPDSSLMILGGAPLNQPVVNHGPFVMTSQKEISDAIMAYRSGKF